MLINLIEERHWVKEETGCPLVPFWAQTTLHTKKKKSPVTSGCRHMKQDVVRTLRRWGWSPGPWSSGLGPAECKGQALCGAVGEESEAGAAVKVDLPQRICCCSATLPMHEQPNCGQPCVVRTGVCVWLCLVVQGFVCAYVLLLPSQWCDLIYLVSTRSTV